MNSKKTLVTFLMFLLMAPAFAQTKTSPAKDCFREWINLFRSHGAKTVTDGTHEVVVSLRSQSGSNCYMGKIDVVNGKLTAPLWMQKEDGSFETFREMGKSLDPEFANMNPDEVAAITDGMSISFRTTDGEYGRIFFYKFLNDKAKPKNKIAPPPGALIKN